MKIRSARKDDLPVLLKLNQAAVPHVSKIGMKEMEWFLKKAKPLFVVEEDGEIAGFMIVLQPGLDYQSLNYRFFCGNFKDFDYVDRIVIGEKFRRKKLGSALYAHLIKHSKKKVITCEVNVAPPNPDSMKFHKQLGFRKIAEQITEKGKKRVAMLVKMM
ncbi:GNAT family N-acetyltransferase [Gracilimonas tropica]|uniref:GNAT family N-acetyltransferase n=1 Tax=Gracilimonas tropica TaxID=454600 RepID=UPI00036F170C|nr:GNAT family N-acetyltransferase [Gracilimonas tropica]